jgi:hypothetical protein
LQSVSNILNSHFRDKNIASIDFKNEHFWKLCLRPLIKKIIEVIESVPREYTLQQDICSWVSQFKSVVIV